MQNRQSNRVLYSDEQAYTTTNYVIPYISDYFEINESFSILEIGCGECGNMRPFLDRNCKVTGVDFSEKKINIAKENK